EQPLPLGILDHRKRDSVLNAASGIGCLQFHTDRRNNSRGNAVKPNERRVTDSFQHISGDLRHAIRSLILNWKFPTLVITPTSTLPHLFRNDLMTIHEYQIRVIDAVTD